jgi:hypothetical protein
MPRIITVKQPNIMKAGCTKKRGIMHTPPGATRFTARDHSEEAAKAHMEEHGKK